MKSEVGRSEARFALRRWRQLPSVERDSPPWSEASSYRPAPRAGLSSGRGAPGRADTRTSERAERPNGPSRAHHPHPHATQRELARATLRRGRRGAGRRGRGGSAARGRRCRSAGGGRSVALRPAEGGEAHARGDVLAAAGAADRRPEAHGRPGQARRGQPAPGPLPPPAGARRAGPRIAARRIHRQARSHPVQDRRLRLAGHPLQHPEPGRHRHHPLPAAGDRRPGPQGRERVAAAGARGPSPRARGREGPRGGRGRASGRSSSRRSSWTRSSPSAARSSRT